MPRLLFLDTLAINRAPTAEAILRDDVRFETRYAATSEKYALCPVTKEDVEWADIVFAMEPMHLERSLDRDLDLPRSCDEDCDRICRLFHEGKPVVCLGIRDHYKYGSEPLKAELKRKMRQDPHWADSFAAEPDRLPEGEPRYRHLRFEDIKDWKRMRNLMYSEFQRALDEDPLLPVTLDQEVDAGWRFDSVRAEAFYDALWTFWYSRTHWGDYYCGDDRRDWGEPYTPTEAEMKCMLMTAIMYADGMSDDTARNGAYGSILYDADMLVRYGRADSRDVLALYLKLAYYCFSKAYRIPGTDVDDIPYCEYMVPLRFEKILDTVREEFLQDFRFARIAGRFLRKLVTYFGEEKDGQPMWARCGKWHAAPYSGFTLLTEKWAKEWLRLLERAETLLHEIGPIE